MSAHIFSFNGAKITHNGKPIDTNVLVKSELIKRFYADICKDATTPNGLTESAIKGLLQSCFKYNITESYHHILGNIKNIYWPKTGSSFIKERTIIKSDLLKETTNKGWFSTQISDANIAFYESGMSPNMVCRSRDIVNIATPATILDTATKKFDDSEFFPNKKDEEIIFNEKFTDALGFPSGTIWSSKTLNPTELNFNLTIKYPIISETITSTIYPLTEKKQEAKRFGNFANYSKGNVKKNNEIKTKMTNCNEIIKILLTKEYGDVAQVWMYFAYVVINNINRTDTIMVTTDSVVLLFCALLDLSCMYTGGREGVSSGHCQLYYYLAGPVDFPKKLKNNIAIIFNHIYGHNQGQLVALEEIKINLDKFKYFRKSSRKGGYELAFGSLKIDQTKIPEIIKMFSAVVIDIENRKTILKTKYDRYMSQNYSAIKNDIEIDRIVNKFENEIKLENLKIESSFTQVKLPGETKGTIYILKPSIILNEYIKLAGISDDDVPKNTEEIMDMIKNIESERQEEDAVKKTINARPKTINVRPRPKPKTTKASIIKKTEQTRKIRKEEVTKKQKNARELEMSKRREMKGGGERNMKESGIGFYECLILCILFNKGIDGPNFLPVIYDIIVSQVSSTKSFNDILNELFKTQSKDYFQEIFELYNDEEIEEKGLELADMYFSFTTKVAVDIPSSIPKKTNKIQKSPSSVAHSPSDLHTTPM